MSRYLKEVRTCGREPWICRGRASQAEGITNARVLRQEHAWEFEKEPVRLFWKASEAGVTEGRNSRA